MDYGQLTEEEFACITKIILELSDVGMALQNDNIEWFHQNKDLAKYYGTLSHQLSSLQKRLAGKCGVPGF